MQALLTRDFRVSFRVKGEVKNRGSKQACGGAADTLRITNARNGSYGGRGPEIRAGEEGDLIGKGERVEKGIVAVRGHGALLL